MKQSKIKLSFYLSIVVNFIVTIIKVTAGILGQSESLIADGLHTISEIISNVIALIGTTITKKRKNQTHPYGYGRVEYLTNLFIGIIMLILGIFIIIKTLISKSETPNISLLLVIGVVILTKLLLGIFLGHKGRDYKSSTLIVSSKQAFLDLYSSIGVFLIVILSQFADSIPFLSYSDFIGSIIIAIIIIKQAIEIMMKNVLALSGEVDLNISIEKEIEEKLEKLEKIDVKDITLIKYGAYYKASIIIDLNKNIKVKEVINIEKHLKNILKHSKYNIKYVTIEIDTKEGEE